MKIAVSEYTKWLKNDKHIVTVLSLICLYLYCLSPIKEYSADFGEPINIIEPYMIFITNALCVPVIIVTFSALMIDFPDISANAAFVLLRTGRTRWYRAQIGFVAIASATFLAVLLVFSFLLSEISYASNVWSNAERIINSAGAVTVLQHNPMSWLDMSVINNFTPIEAMITGSFLMVLHMVFAAQLQITVTLKFNKIIGVASNLLVLGAGMALHFLDTHARWIFPFSHATLSLHYDSVFSTVNFPIWGSILYLIAANVVMYLVGVSVIRRKNLSLMSKED